MGASFQDYRGLIQSHIIDDIIKTDPKLKRMLNKTYETPFKHCLLVAYFKKQTSKGRAWWKKGQRELLSCGLNNKYSFFYYIFLHNCQQLLLNKWPSLSFYVHDKWFSVSLESSFDKFSFKYFFRVILYCSLWCRIFIDLMLTFLLFSHP